MSTKSSTELDIIAEVIAPDGVPLDPDVARACLKWKFSDESIARMNWLANRNRRGEITREEWQELERFIRAGTLIDIIQARARLSLRKLNAE